MSETNVCTEIVAYDLCSGCGACAAVCPKQTLDIQWNPYGEYNAVDQHGRCLARCGLCLQVCPFAPVVENEDSLGKKLLAEIPNIQHRPETGFYLQAFVGYSDMHDHRLNSSSGGLATWVLEILLQNNLVDHAICVASSKDKDKLFQFTVCTTPEQVRACAKSSYYPVELSAVLRHVMIQEGSYALVGLPCAIKAIRLAMQKLPVLKQRIKYLLGLICGQQKGKFFSEYVMALKGADPRRLSALRFREKDPKRPVTDYGLRYECDTGCGQNAVGRVFWSEGMGRAWLARYFTLNACNYCDDLFAELADASFMDAWLPEYDDDWRGTSIVLTRNPALNSLIKQGQEKQEVVMEPMAIERVIQSQAGALSVKRAGLAKRLSWAVRRDRTVPSKRVTAGPCGLADSLALTIEMANMEQSKKAFLSLKSKDRITANEFSQRMRRVAMGHKLIAGIIRKLLQLKQRISG